MDRALNPMTGGLLRNRKETQRDTERKGTGRWKRDWGMQRQGENTKAHWQPPETGRQAGRASHSDEIGCVQGGVAVDSFSLRAARKGQPVHTLI